MSSYCLKCRKNTENIILRASKTINGKTMTLSKSAICCSKKSKFSKEQKTKWLLCNLGFKTPLSKIEILGDVLF